MTIFADYSFMFIVGLLYSLMNYDLIKRSGSVFKNKYFLYAIIFQTVFCMPLSILCYIVYPDWCLMYWVDSSLLPIWVPIIFYAIYYLFLMAGYWIGYSAENKSRGFAMNLLLLSIIYLVIFRLISSVVSVIKIAVSGFDFGFADSTHDIDNIKYREILIDEIKLIFFLSPTSLSSMALISCSLNIFRKPQQLLDIN